MKKRKKILSTLVGVAIASQILPGSRTIANAQTTNNTNKLVKNQTQDSQSQNIITLSGVGCQEGIHKFDLVVDNKTNTLKIENTIGENSSGNHAFHPYFNGEYISITLLDKDGNIKEDVSMNGTENLKKIKDAFNNFKFEYGDRLRIHHQEADWRVKISGDVYNIDGQKVNLAERTSKDDLNKYDFEITESGLKEVPTFTNELNKTEIALAGVGCQEGTHKFDIALNPITKKLEVNDIVGLAFNHPIHPNFKGEYINITLLDSDGNIKNTFSMNGTDKLSKVQNELNGWNFEYGDRLRIHHSEADARVRISGNISNTSREKLDLRSGTNKKDLNKYDFEITKSGLQEVPAFTNELNKTKITLAGVGCQEGTHRFDIALNPTTKKLEVNNIVGLAFNHPIHPNFKGEYINVTLLDSDGNVKNTFSMKGTDKLSKVQNELNGWNFEYGDRLRVKHSESDWRVKIDGNINNTSREKLDLSDGTSKKDLSKYDFEITKSGLEEVPAFTNELNKTKITLAGVGCQEGIHKFDIVLNPKTKKLEVHDMVGLTFNHPIHPNFKGEYINIQLLASDGTVKNTFSMNGTDKLSKVQNELDGWNFEYGDRLRIKHSESDWRVKIFGNVTDTTSKIVNLSEKTSKDTLSKCDFEITKLGLQEVSISNN